MEVMAMEEKVMDATMEGPREKLRQILEKHGEAILQDSDRVEGLLRDHCGSFRKEISALVGALNERVPTELKGSWQAAMTPEAMRARLVQRLEDNRGLNADVAAWAVDTWSYALGIGLGRRSERLDSVVLQEENKFKGTGGGAAGFGALQGGGQSDGNRPMTDEERRAAIASDQPGQRLKKAGLLESPEGKKKAGVGAVAVVLALVAAVALTHKKTDPVVVVPPVNNGGSTQTQPDKKDQGPPTPHQDQGTKPPDVTPAVEPVQQEKPVVVSAIATGTVVNISLNQSINSDEVTPGQTFEATLSAPLTLNGKTVLPRGAEATIKVASVDEGGKITGQTVMLLTLVELSSGGKKYRVSTGSASVLGPKQAVEAAKRGGIGGAAGAVGGFVVGKIFHHGGTGAAAGAGTGAAVGVATTKPKPAIAKAEKLLSFKLTRPLTVSQ